MSNVITFLEKMGQDAALRHASQDDVKLALANAQIDPELQAAIAGRNQAAVEALLGAKSNVCCALFPKKDDEEEDEPSRDDDEVSGLYVTRRIASTV